MIIDTHVHLDDKRYKDDLDEVLNRAREGGVERFIIPAADPANLDRAVEIAQKNSDVYFAVGVHPYDMDKFDTLEFNKYIEHPKCVAVGECGLDYLGLRAQKMRSREKKRGKKRSL
jgi:TatD DNase family protein